jgi:hypothetical protein
MTKGPNLRLATAPTAQDSRDELRAAIAAAAAAEGAAETARGAVSRAGDMIGKAQARLEVATADVVRARDLQAKRMAQAAASGASMSPDLSMREARARQTDASDELEAAGGALSACEAASAEWEREQLDHARKRVAAAADEVIKAASPARLLKEAEAMQADLVARRVALRYLLREGLIGDHDRETVHRFLVANHLPGAPPITGFLGSVEHQNWNEHPAAEAWRQAREALMRDPDAQLPVSLRRIAS